MEVCFRRYAALTRSPTQQATQPPVWHGPNRQVCLRAIPWPRLSSSRACCAGLPRPATGFPAPAPPPPSLPRSRSRSALPALPPPHTPRPPSRTHGLSRRRRIALAGLLQGPRIARLVCCPQSLLPSKQASFKAPLLPYPQEARCNVCTICGATAPSSHTGKRIL